MKTDKLLELYNKLDLNDKRNELNSLANKTGKLIDMILNLEGYASEVPVKNYNKNSHKDLEEGEMLSFIYEDLWNLKNQLILLLAVVRDKKIDF